MGRLKIQIKLLVFVLHTMIFYGSKAQSTITIDRNWSVRKIPESLYGFNGQIWDGNQSGNNVAYNNLLKNAGIKVMRWPGGSWGDIIKWSDTKCFASYAVTYEQSKTLYESLGIKFQPIVNFSGSFCNTQQTHDSAVSMAKSWVSEGALDAQYWEIGNELMGSWEQGHTIGKDYGDRFSDFYDKMKAVNKDLKLIAVGDPNDKDDCYNPGTGSWTRELLKASIKKGVVPDGFQIHTYPGGLKYDMLHSSLDDIGKYTRNLNYMVSSETGRGQLAYAMTEFGASGDQRWIKMIGAQLVLQYFMEMAKYNWAVANVWGEIYNTTSYKASPVWYVYAFLNSRFGQEMVNAKSDNDDVRSYASVDIKSKLTFWVCNNSLAEKEVTINLLNFKPEAKGEVWVMEGAGGSGEESYDIAINGVEHPSEANAMSMAGKEIAVDTSFTIKLPASSFALFRLVPAGTNTCSPARIVPRMKIDTSDWEEQINVAVESSKTITISPTSDVPGTWQWEGPNGYNAKGQEIVLNSLDESGEYVVSCQNECGQISKQSFIVQIGNYCDSTIISPNLQVNGQSWQSVSDVSVTVGSTVMFGPQPFDGMWSWTDSKGNVIGTSRECTVTNIQESGNYLLTYTNNCGAKTRTVFHIEVKLTNGLNDMKINDDLIIYPNPSMDGSFRIDSNSILENLDIKIFNLQGVQMFFQSGICNKALVKTDLQPGFYIIVLSNCNNRFYSNLIVE
jgi:alpha-L-arabinofuranosidase